MTRRLPGTLASFLIIALAVASPARSQISLQPTPAPTVTGEMATWYQDREPIAFNGNLYYPSGPQVFFNGNEMVRSGWYRGIPLYTRTTLETNSYVFVPLAGKLMQPYERRRTGELAGTVGSSAPSFPVDRDSEIPAGEYEGVGQAAGPPTNLTPYPLPPTDSAVRTPYSPRPIATTGIEPAVPADTQARVSTRRRGALNGVYVEYSGSKWFSSGPSQRFDAARFTAIGTYDNGPVYSDASGQGRTIYLPIPESGGFLVAPYSLRQP